MKKGRDGLPSPPESRSTLQHLAFHGFLVTRSRMSKSRRVIKRLSYWRHRLWYLYGPTYRNDCLKCGFLAFDDGSGLACPGAWTGRPSAASSHGWPLRRRPGRSQHAGTSTSAREACQLPGSEVSDSYLGPAQKGHSGPTVPISQIAADDNCFLPTIGRPLRLARDLYAGAL